MRQIYRENKNRKKGKYSLREGKYWTSFNCRRNRQNTLEITKMLSIIFVSQSNVLCC